MMYFVKYGPIDVIQIFDARVYVYRLRYSAENF